MLVETATNEQTSTRNERFEWVKYTHVAIRLELSMLSFFTNIR